MSPAIVRACALTLVALAVPGLAACSGASDGPVPITTPVTDAAVPRAEAGASASGLAGTVKDKAGEPVGGAKIEVGSASVFSDTQGKYSLPLAAAGAVTLKITRNWFKPFEEMVTVASDRITTRDLTIEEIPLKLDPADVALAESYNKTFDWTKQTVSISIVQRPTRRDFDNAVFFRNPALYRDTSKEPALSPSPLPEIAAGTAKNFSFELKSGKNMGQEALDLGSVVDAIKDTPLAPGEVAGFMMWTPLLTWIGEWDAAKAADLRAVGVAVRQQNWGGNVARPQEIERVFIDGRGALWAEVVFARFVQLGAGITDSDGDGRKEIFARIADVHYSSEVVDRLSKEYGKTVFTTHGLSREVSKSLNELYSSTAAKVERMVGQPIEIAGVGTINYPFVALVHSGMQRNVILVAP